jgi:hypothetical protein
MGYHKTVAVLTVAGLAGSSALADTAQLDVAGPELSGIVGPTAISYIAGLVGPSHVAPPTGTHAASSGMDRSSLLFMVAGPDNTAKGPVLTIDGVGLGDGPGTGGPAPVPPALTTADVVSTLQPVDYRTLQRHGDTQTEGDPRSGEFQVVVPLPGAGALAGAGLAFVAIRRRRR